MSGSMQIADSKQHAARVDEQTIENSERGWQLCLQKCGTRNMEEARLSTRASALPRCKGTLRPRQLLFHIPRPVAPIDDLGSVVSTDTGC